MPKLFSRVLRKEKARRQTGGKSENENKADTGEVSGASAGDGIGPLHFPDDCEGKAIGTDLVSSTEFAALD